MKMRWLGTEEMSWYLSALAAPWDYLGSILQTQTVAYISLSRCLLSFATFISFCHAHSVLIIIISSIVIILCFAYYKREWERGVSWWQMYFMWQENRNFPLNSQLFLPAEDCLPAYSTISKAFSRNEPLALRDKDNIWLPHTQNVDDWPTRQSWTEDLWRNNCAKLPVILTHGNFCDCWRLWIKMYLALSLVV